MFYKRAQFKQFAHACCAALITTSLVMPVTAGRAFAQSEVRPQPIAQILCVAGELDQIPIDDVTTDQQPCDAFFSTIQEAVDAVSQDWSEIRVAGGEYNQVDSTVLYDQLVHITKSLELRGGYSTDNWYKSDPVANPTIITPQGNGRALFIDGTDRTIYVNVVGFEILSGRAPLNDEEGAIGGAIRIKNAKVKLEKNRIKENSAERGGALYASHSIVYLVQNHIENNEANSEKLAAGGGIYLEVSGLHLTENVIEENSASGPEISAGAGIAGDRCLVVSDGNNTVSDNHTRSGNIGLGGGATFANCDIYLRNDTIQQNSVTAQNTSHGGGIYHFGGSSLDGSSRFMDSTIDGNRAQSMNGDGQGGGLYLAQSGELLEPVYLVKNMFNNNALWTDDIAYDTESDLRGAGLSMDASIAVVVDNQITSNRIVGFNAPISLGAGIYMTGTATYLGRNQLSWNESESKISGGGGIGALFSAVAMADTVLEYNRTYGDRLSGGSGGYFLESFILADNTVALSNRGGNYEAKNLGSGLLLDGHDNLPMEFRHTTVRWNSDITYGDPATTDQPDSGVGLWDGKATFTNSIFADESIALAAHNNSQLAINGVLWFNNGGDAVGQGTIFMRNAYHGDPFFDYYYDPVTYELEEYHIGPSSAAIDRGVETPVTKDIDGEARDDQPDLGADEYYPRPTHMPLDPELPGATDPLPPADTQPIEIEHPSPNWPFDAAELTVDVEAELAPPAAVGLPSSELIPSLPANEDAEAGMSEEAAPAEDAAPEEATGYFGDGILDTSSGPTPFVQASGGPIQNIAELPLALPTENPAAGNPTGDEQPEQDQTGNDGDGISAEEPNSGESDGNESDDSETDGNESDGSESDDSETDGNDFDGGERGGQQFSSSTKLYLPAINNGN